MGGLSEALPKPLIIDGGTIDLHNVLNPEAVFDFEMENNGFLCIKAELDYPVISRDGFGAALHAFDGNVVTLDCSSKSYGDATMMEPLMDVLSTKKFYDEEAPYNFAVNFMGKKFQMLRKQMNLDPWFNIGGVLPATIKTLDGISSPNFTFCVSGTKTPLHRGPFQFANVHYISKGCTKWQLISGSKFGNITDVLKNYLLENGHPRRLFQCDHFLQHQEMYFTPAFLQEQLGAVEVVQEAGEVLFIQPNVYYQCENEEGGMSISYNCVPTRWLDLDSSKDDCVCASRVIRLEPTKLEEVREHVVRQNNYGASMKMLELERKRESSLQFYQMTYEQTIKIQHEFHNDKIERGVFFLDDDDEMSLKIKQYEITKRQPTGQHEGMSSNKNMQQTLNSHLADISAYGTRNICGHDNLKKS